MRLWKRVGYQLWIGLTFILFVQCSAGSSEKSNQIEQDTTENEVINVEEEVAPFEVNYHLINTEDTLNWLKSLEDGDTLAAILALNRVDRHNMYKQDTLVFPDTIGTGIDLYAPFPEKMEELIDIPKILLVSYYSQAFAVFENGIRVKWGPVSLGKKTTQTPTGLFAANWKSKRTISTVDPTWVMDWYFNIDNFEGVSIHEYALPGYPASHACVRLSHEDAFWLYHWIDQWMLNDGQITVYGTPVIIFGDFPYDGRKPWLNLVEDNKTLENKMADFSLLLDDYLPIILERQAKRDSVNLKLEDVDI